MEDPKKDQRPYNDEETALRREATLKRMLSTPHKPHKPLKAKKRAVPKKPAK
jgi:hypothetical protein